jgi:hypothetical protein
MAVRQPVDYEQALERIAELEQELESLDALLLLRERSASNTGARHTLADVARELGTDEPLSPPNNAGLTRE